MKHVSIFLILFMISVNVALAATVSIGDTIMSVEVMCSREDRSRGLQGRETLAENEGMLFVFEEPMKAHFWMKNTLIPLDIAFIDGKGKIVSIEAMEPETTDSHRSPIPVRYALETNQGWFADREICVGAIVSVDV